MQLLITQKEANKYKQLYEQECSLLKQMQQAKEKVDAEVASLRTQVETLENKLQVLNDTVSQ